MAERENKTVVATIHQPSSQIFSHFDKLLLLSEGQTVFHGKARDAVPYFASKNLVCPEEYNPADYFMTILSGKKPVIR
jgi:ABC-type multidrug transport system ATPase subunit